MILVGDIAQPYKDASLYSVPGDFKTEIWLGNLEGSLIHGGGIAEEISCVYNDLNAIKGLIKHIPFKSFCIANNHLLDVSDVQTTLDNAKQLGVPVVGAGLNLKDARQPLLISDTDNIEYCVFAFGWENIQCVPASDKKQGVNPATKNNVLSSVKEAISHNRKVICFFHWDYELEKYPQPYDRQLAIELIDLGVTAVIGCHAHRTQPVEFYKGKPIVYGLGNFLFCQGHYFEGNLCFPKFCEEEYAFEITKNGYRLHYFHYDQQSNKLEYVKSAEISEEKEYEGKAVFSGFSAKEYERFFKKNRVQKKLLPIFYSNESAASYWCKSQWIKLRGWMLDYAMRLHLKSAKRADR